MHLAKLLLPLVALALLAGLAACPPPSDDDDEHRDAGIDVVDSGVGGEDEGVGEGEGEGEGECAPGCETPQSERTCDASGQPVITPCGANEACTDTICEGIQGQEYSGTAEDGVVCDATTCAGADSVCCVTATTAIVATCIAPTDTCQGGFLAVPLACDGVEDCNAGEECCIDGETLVTTCVPVGSCTQTGQTDSVVCVTTADCAVDQLCCGLADMQLPVDVGACAPAANNCSG